MKSLSPLFLLLLISGPNGAGPCKALAPIIEDVAQKYTDKVRFVKLDVDHNPSTPQKFGVRGIPTLILFKDGQVKATQVGLLGKADLVKFIDDHI